MSVGKMGSKTKPGGNFEAENRGFLYNIKSTCSLTDIHTHDLVYLNVYSLTISTLNIGYIYFSKYHRLLFSLMVPDEMGSKPGLCFKAVLQL